MRYCECYWERHTVHESHVTMWWQSVTYLSRKRPCITRRLRKKLRLWNPEKFAWIWRKPVISLTDSSALNSSGRIPDKLWIGSLHRHRHNKSASTTVSTPTFCFSLYNALDRPSNHFCVCLCVCLCVCVWTDQLSNDYVCSSLPIFAKFLHAAQ